MLFTKKIFFLNLLLVIVIAVPLLVGAQAFNPPEQGNYNPPDNSLKLDPPLKSINGKDATLESFIGAILNDIVLPIGAVVVVIFIIYSGFLFVTAQGNETKLEKAKTTFLWTVIGAAVLLGSWAIAQVIKTTIDQLRGTASIIMTSYLG
jgi:hypothetical protein